MVFSILKRNGLNRTACNAGPAADTLFGQDLRRLPPLLFLKKNDGLPLTLLLAEMAENLFSRKAIIIDGNMQLSVWLLIGKMQGPARTAPGAIPAKMTETVGKIHERQPLLFKDDQISFTSSGTGSATFAKIVEFLLRGRPGWGQGQGDGRGGIVLHATFRCSLSLKEEGEAFIEKKRGKAHNMTILTDSANIPAGQRERRILIKLPVILICIFL